MPDMRLNKVCLTKIPVDWRWVKKRLLEMERIRPPSSPGSNKLILAAADKCLKLAGPLAKVRAAWAVYEIDSLNRESVNIKSGYSFSSKRLAGFLKGSDSLAVFLVTIGSSLEKAATMWMDQGEHLYGYLTDRIGSLAVEFAAELFEEKIRKTYESKGMSVSMRFSPGYCDWPIEDQRKLAGLLDFSKAGVRITDACVLVPKKSISAIVGIAPRSVFTKTGSQCEVCNIKACDYRRTIQRV